MSKILIVDTNRATYPVYQALYEQGHEVWVVGANPDEPLAKLATHYVQLDYSDTYKLASLVDEKGFDYLVPGCTDLSYQVCAKINNSRFPGIDTVENTYIINTKDEFRRIAAQLNIPVPKVLSADDALNVDTVIVKPVDAFSGRGIHVLHQPTQKKLNQVIQTSCKASKSNNVIIEKFVHGQLYSHSAFVRDGRVIADFIVQEDCTVYPFAVDTSRLANNFPETIQSSLRDDISRLFTSLNLVDGLMHTQIIVQGDNYWIIEMTRRCPGDIYALLIELSTEYHYAANYAAPFVSAKAQAPEANTSNELIIRHTMTSKKATHLWGFKFHYPTDIRLFVPLATSGDFIDSSPYGRAGIFFLYCSSKQEQEVLYKKLLMRELYDFS